MPKRDLVNRYDFFNYPTDFTIAKGNNTNNITQTIYNKTKENIAQLRFIASMDQN